jgi:phosphoribosylformimino-5-aminoimidazole carboxamide ribonucleotide (ProFAR) isomerase
LKIFPTLNIQQGRVIPTFGGDAPADQSPLELVQTLLDHGCTHLALVDVDAARNAGHNRELMGRLLKACKGRPRGQNLCVQIAGGLRSSDQCSFYLDQGASWLVVGTILQKSPMVVDQLLARFQEHLTAGIDARGGHVHCSGWLQSTGIPAEEMAKQAKAYGFRRLLFVDVPKDDHSEPDYDTAIRMQEAAHLPLLMGGSLDSLTRLQAAQATQALHGGLVDALLFLGDPELMGLLPQACA